MNILLDNDADHHLVDSVHKSEIIIKSMSNIFLIVQQKLQIADKTELSTEDKVLIREVCRLISNLLEKNFSL